MKRIKFRIIVGLFFLIASMGCIYALLQSHKAFEYAIKNNLSTESLRTPNLFDIVIFLVLVFFGIISLIFMIWNIYKLKKKNAVQHRV